MKYLLWSHADREVLEAQRNPPDGVYDTVEEAQGADPYDRQWVAASVKRSSDRGWVGYPIPDRANWWAQIHEVPDDDPRVNPVKVDEINVRVAKQPG